MIELPKKKYNIVYADPPWSAGLGWNKNHSGKKCPARHYPVQGSDWIKNLPVDTIADTNCALFLWVTFPCLPLGLEVISSWGFRYATIGFNWVKRNKVANSYFMGCGNYTRANSEVCLLGIKGSMKRQSASVHSVLDDRIMRHSEKPAIVRDRIVELFGDLPRIELFARTRVPGWDAFGNEI